jgi:hypothetical protein
VRIPESRRSRRAARPLVVAIPTLVLLGFLYLLPGGPGASESFTSDAPDPLTFESSERQRIRQHLAEVEAEMRARDVSGLTSAQQSARAGHLEALAAYRAAGHFPRNLGHPGELVPYFVDDRGVLCAVGYLLHRSGQGPLVQRIAAERNHATVPELADEPALVAWLEDAGITLEEAARIQPAYCGGDPEHCWGLGPWDPTPDPQPEPSPTAYRAVSAGFLSVQGVALGWNLVSLLRGETSGWKAGLALGAGTAGFGIGAHGVGEDHTRGLGLVNLGAGVATLAGGVVAYRARDRRPPVDWEAFPVVPLGPAPIGVLASSPPQGTSGPETSGRAGREGEWHPPFRVPAAPGSGAGFTSTVVPGSALHHGPAYSTDPAPPEASSQR